MGAAAGVGRAQVRLARIRHPATARPRPAEDAADLAAGRLRVAHDQGGPDRGRSAWGDAGAASPAVAEGAAVPAPFREQLEKALARVRRHGETLAVLCLDLGRCGSPDGRFEPSTEGALLPAVERRLRGCVRDTDTVTRIGRRFAVLEVRLNGPDGAAILARRLIAAIGRPYEIQGCRIDVDVAIGIALAPSDGTDPDLLMQRAEEAMARAKSEGGGTFRFHGPEAEARDHAR